MWYCMAIIHLSNQAQGVHFSSQLGDMIIYNIPSSLKRITRNLTWLRSHPSLIFNSGGLPGHSLSLEVRKALFDFQWLRHVDYDRWH